VEGKDGASGPKGDPGNPGLTGTVGSFTHSQLSEKDFWPTIGTFTKDWASYPSSVTKRQSIIEANLSNQGWVYG
jgi:hypothetical protein